MIDEGRRTATYKLAVLLSLMDCCAEQATPTGEAPVSFDSRHRSSCGPLVLAATSTLSGRRRQPRPRQLRTSRPRSSTHYGRRFQPCPHVGTWDAAEAMLPADHVREVLDVVELTVAKYPLVRLQTVDGVPTRFIYEIDWGESVTLNQLSSNGGAGN